MRICLDWLALLLLFVFTIEGNLPVDLEQIFDFFELGDKNL